MSVLKCLSISVVILAATVVFICGPRFRGWLDIYDKTDVFNENSPFFHGEFFSSVKNESIITEFEIEGEIPKDINGLFLRIGPNQDITAPGRNHWFSGDGMVHGIRIKNGKVLYYTNSYLKTNAYTDNKNAGYNIQYPMGDAMSNNLLWILFKVLILGNLQKYYYKYFVNSYNSDYDKFGNTKANTNIMYNHYNGKLYALYESSVPFWFSINEDYETEEKQNINYSNPIITSAPGNTVNFTNWEYAFSAHSYYDTENDVIYTIDPYTVDGYYIYGKINAKTNEVMTQFKLKNPTGIKSTTCHEIIVTKDYVIIYFPPITVVPDNPNKHDGLDKSGNATMYFAVFKKSETDMKNIKWYELKQSIWIFHSTAYQVGDDIYIYSVVYNDWLMDFTYYPQAFVTEYRRMIINLNGNSKSVTYEKINSDNMSHEFVTFNNHILTGNYYRYSYHMRGRISTFQDRGNIYDKNTFLTDLKNNKIKIDKFLDPIHSIGCSKYDNTLDLSKQLISKITVDKKYNIHECKFIAREVDNKEAQDSLFEDDGYIITFVYNYESKTSDLWIFNGKTMNNKPLAKIHLGVKVPMGFHAIWLNEQQLKKHYQNQ